jgi:hypothetical protein
MEVELDLEMRKLRPFWPVLPGAFMLITIPSPSIDGLPTPPELRGDSDPEF